MDINRIVSVNFRNLREQRNLSLDTVAKLSGVSKSMLAQIERGEVNPTISVLWKIANGLKISFSVLLDKHTGDMEVIKKGDVAPVLEDSGRFINYPVFSFDDEHGFEMFRIVLLPSSVHISQPHLSGTEEFITVYSGTVQVTLNTGEHVLGAGDSIRFRSDVIHGYKNTGDGTAELSMVIYYPGKTR
jgi:transcriptional regulator with XRE-family HTH domain